jgi:uncharacterized protein (DUF342 family)
MNVSDAWTVLGKDWNSIAETLSSLPDAAARIQATESLLIDAKKLAKKLMAVHHPDKNPGDFDAAARFQRVKDALLTIEDNTESFKAKHESMKARAEQRAASDGFIVIK